MLFRSLYLKDRLLQKDAIISQKDAIIEQLQDGSKLQSSSSEISQQIWRLSGNGSLRSCDRISPCPQNHTLVNGISNEHTSPTGTGAAGSDVAECEDVPIDNMPHGCSLAGTKYSVGGASEVVADMYVVFVAFYFRHLSSLLFL